MCNQAAGFSRCITKVQDNMCNFLKDLQDPATRDKLSPEGKSPADELAHLMSFNQGISRAMARTMQDLSDFVFISLANV